jgi:hypothetical protein
LSAVKTEIPNTIIKCVARSSNVLPNATIAKFDEGKMAAKAPGRQVSSMTPRTRAIHDLLEQYFDHPAVRSDGASGMSTIARLMKYGPMGASHFGPTTPPELPEKLHIVDASIRHLNVNMQTCVVMTYHGKPIEAVARTIHCSHAVAKNILKMARYLIGSFCEGRGINLPAC